MLPFDLIALKKKNTKKPILLFVKDYGLMTTRDKCGYYARNHATTQQIFRRGKKQRKE